MADRVPPPAALTLASASAAKVSTQTTSGALPHTLKINTTAPLQSKSNKRLVEMEDYSSAAARHWKDAELLARENRVENADHHYGFAAECAIKKTLVTLHAFSASGVLGTAYKQHINMLWDKVGHQSLQKSYPKLLAILKAANAFADWDVSQRYFVDGTVTSAALASHKKMTSRLLGAVNLPGERRA